MKIYMFFILLFSLTSTKAFEFKSLKYLGNVDKKFNSDTKNYYFRVDLSEIQDLELKNLYFELNYYKDNKLKNFYYCYTNNETDCESFKKIDNYGSTSTKYKNTKYYEIKYQSEYQYIFLKANFYYIAFLLPGSLNFKSTNEKYSVLDSLIIFLIVFFSIAVIMGLYILILRNKYNIEKCCSKFTDRIKDCFD